jgi:hypothetical protein
LAIDRMTSNYQLNDMEINRKKPTAALRAAAKRPPRLMPNVRTIRKTL